MMRIFHFNFLLIFSIYPIGSQGDDDPKGSGNQIYRNSSSISSKNESEETITETDVVFIAYNRENPNGNVLSLDTRESELKSILLPNINTTFITHGWLGSENGSYLTDIRLAYLRKNDMNVIVVGWSKISRNEYVITTLGVPKVGAVVGRMVSNLLNAGLVTLDNIHLVGHSLGAHVMGIAGGFIRDSDFGKVKRITGLDPAKPGYEQIREENDRLDSNDGQFVDIIHTNIGLFGYSEALGHADFYPNGGDHQPGCTLTINIFCSHLKALEYFKESIDNELAFPSVKCDSFFKYTSNQCESKEVIYMGEPTPSSARGTFYLQTNQTQ